MADFPEARIVLSHKIQAHGFFAKEKPKGFLRRLLRMGPGYRHERWDKKVNLWIEIPAQPSQVATIVEKIDWISAPDDWWYRVSSWEFDSRDATYIGHTNESMHDNDLVKGVEPSTPEEANECFKKYVRLHTKRGWSLSYPKRNQGTPYRKLHEEVAE